MARRAMHAWLAAAVLTVATPAAADEPYWNSRPLSHWVGVLQTGEPSERARAARGLAEIAHQAGPEALLPAFPTLVASLSSADAGLRAAAAAAIGAMAESGAPAVGLLASLFDDDPDPLVRIEAGLALARVAPADGRVVLVSAVVLGTDAEAEARRAAAAILVEAGPAAAPAEPALLRAMTDSDARVRVFAAAAVGQQGRTGDAVPVLLASLTHEDPAVRVEAAVLLGGVAPAHAAAVVPLTSALADRESEVRQAAAQALGQIGRPAQSAIQPLWRLMRDPDEHVRESALRAIGRIRE